MSGRRTFDWDEAARLRESGLSYSEIAKRMGVSPSAVALATNPEQRRKSMIRARQWQQQHGGTNCADCGTPIKWTSRQYKGPTRCRPCAIKRSATTVRDDTLWCSACREWKTDEQFYGGGCFSRRGRSQECKTCSNLRRKALRDRNRVPCSGCGTLVLSPRDNNRRGTGMCHACFSKTRRKTLAP